jgi:FdhD protein
VDSLGDARSSQPSAPASLETPAIRLSQGGTSETLETLAVEEPLEIRLIYGSAGAPTSKSISITMRTPGHDAELALGFLFTEGVLRDGNDVRAVTCRSPHPANTNLARKPEKDGGDPFAAAEPSYANHVTVELLPEVEVNISSLQRNFYTTSSCGVCGKASLLALRTLCPPRTENTMTVDARTIYELPSRLLSAQSVFARTGGLHAAALFDSNGVMDSLREDVGRHNALDKLLGAAILADSLPLRNHLLLLSGRASFELVQKAVMGGIPIIASVGAPSSLAVEVAKDFDITLIGFLRGDRFNIYHGAERVRLPSIQ